MVDDVVRNGIKGGRVLIQHTHHAHNSAFQSCLSRELVGGGRESGWVNNFQDLF